MIPGASYLAVRRRRTKQFRIDSVLIKEFERRCKSLGVRSEADMMEFILRKYLYPRERMLKLVAADKFEEFEYIRELIRKETNQREINAMLSEKEGTEQTELLQQNQ
jgi:hypothetical protein